MANLLSLSLDELRGVSRSAAPTPAPTIDPHPPGTVNLLKFIGDRAGPVLTLAPAPRPTVAETLQTLKLPPSSLPSLANLLREFGISDDPPPAPPAPPQFAPPVQMTPAAPLSFQGVPGISPAWGKAFDSVIKPPSAGAVLPPAWGNAFDRQKPAPTYQPAPPMAGPEVRIAVIGTRTFRDWTRFAKEMDKRLALIQTERQSANVVLISGGAEGPDVMARRYAQQNRLRIVEYMPNFPAHGRGATFVRNRQIVNAAQEVIAFWDGVSRGTRFTLDLANEKQLPVHVVTTDRTDNDQLQGAPAADVKTPSDLTRILQLAVNHNAEVPDLTDRFKRTGIAREDLFPGPLKPVQSQSLFWAQAQGGLIGAIGVGGGKTLTSFLLPVAVGSRVAVLFVPPHLYRKTVKDFGKLHMYWTLPTLGDFRRPVAQRAEGALDLGGAETILYVVSMGQLSTAANSDLLDRLDPDLVIVDEAHYLRGNKSARAKRFSRYFQHRSRTKACFLSGTLTNSALTDYWHLCRWALKDGSPLPLSAHTAQVFDAVFGTKSEEQRRAEAAARGIDLPSQGYLDDIGRRYCKWAGVDDPHVAFRQRLVSTPGWVATSAVDCDAGLTIVERSCDLPLAIQKALCDVEESWQTPDGDEFESGLELEQALMTISAGFYNVWEWENGIVDKEWLEARRNWSKAVRTLLKRNLPHLDSPLLVDRACVRADERIKDVVVDLDMERKARLVDLHAAWQKVRFRPAPGTRAIWIDQFLCKEVVEMARNVKGGVIIWHESPAFGDALESLSGWPRFGAGDKDSRALTELAQKVLDGKEKPGPIICSILSHGTGRNLQGWDRAIVAQTPGRGDAVEQLLGRLHREGQQSDEVVFEWMLHTEWARKQIAKARTEAEYQQRTLGQPQRLLLATVESAEDFGSEPE